MARWDEILSLPVQSPPNIEFSAADIVWSRVEGWRETMDKLALIPFSRVNDFVRGESNNKDCPTRFHVEARRRRSPEMANKLKVDGILEYILYWCSFGPDDHRKGGVVRPSRTYCTKRKTPAGRPNTKRGCVCHFIVKRLIAEPSVALVIYNQDKHVDKKGLPCHGLQDTKSVGTSAMFAPCISDELRLQIMSLLYVGVPVETIMQRHTEAVEKQGGPSNRDDLLTHRYVRRLERKIRRSTYELDPNDGISSNMWVEMHRDHVFFYEDFSDSEPFVLGIQTDWQLQQMIQFGNRSVIASDSRFGTNKLKYSVYSLLVFDSKRNAIPVAWIITARFSSGEIHRWMRSLYDRIRSKDPTWKLGGFIVDDPLADVNVIREVFQCSILISFWRVRHSWHKNLMNKCSDIGMQVEVSTRLGEIVSNICRDRDSLDSFHDFIEDFVDCLDFLDYFKGVWFPKLGAWTNILKSLPLASTEVSSAIECYHNQLKLRLLNEKDSNIYQRADWLVDKLGTKVHSYYWLDEYSGKDNFARYWKDEWKCGLTAWRRALDILDSDVVFDGNSATVVHPSNPRHVHLVLIPGSEFAICDCNWSKMGNLCEHVIKSNKIYHQNRSNSLSTSMFQYKRTLMNLLKCPPHNSLLRDHAISLAASVQAQLNSLFAQEFCASRTGKSVPLEERVTAEPTSTSNKAPNNVNDVLNKNQEAPLENFSIAGASIQPTEKSSAGFMAAEEQISAGKASESLYMEGPSLDSRVYQQLHSSRDGMLVDDNINEVAITKKMKKVDQSSMECFQSVTEYGVTEGLAKDKCGRNFSDVHERRTDVGDSCAPSKPSASIVVAESHSIGDEKTEISTTVDDSFCDANGLNDPAYHGNGVAYCSRIIEEPSSDFRQANIVKFESADVKVCMDIDVLRSEEKVCDNGDNVEVY
ncbi:hypothetical protein KFK09_020784 [Dendrobium nobile]|uniref:SWIM-type domain-containing protein n=1 Tax=Dendrobium nobile TaxID=94219 RepID=A0A8T3AMM7_DENNO|nr:hypothetical protein KFK09_020784 [Dendrobium nobile]